MESNNLNLAVAVLGGAFLFGLFLVYAKDFINMVDDAWEDK